jgi:hypothetical protein
VASRAVRLVPWLSPLLPALVAGVQLAAILFFLNPELPFTPWPVARATLYFALIAAPLSLVAHALVARAAGTPVARVLPWGLTVVAAFGALGDAVHASRYAFFLPEAMNRQLIKGGLWMGLAAILLFYTALLHSLNRRPYGTKSWLLVGIAVFGGIAALLDRRTSFHAAAGEPLPLAAERIVEAPRVVVVALPTATLDSLLPLARQGRLPFFARLLDTGASARLEVASPPVRAALWTSWASGKQPHRHGIVGPHRYTAPLLGSGAELTLLPLAPGFARWGLPGGRSEPFVAGDRRALTAWEIQARLGHSAEALGFPDWLGGAPFPAAVEALGSSLAERELVALGRVGFAGLLGEDRRRFARLRERAPRARPGSLLVAKIPGLEQVSLALYGGFAAARVEGARAGVVTRAAEAYELYLGGLDAELARLWDELPAPRLLAVTSAYGVGEPTGLRRLTRFVSSGGRELRGSLAEAPAGVLVLAGDDLLPSRQITEARAVDLVPTLLYAAGAPIARDFDGRVLTELFTPALLQRRALTFVPSFEALPPP